MTDCIQRFLIRPAAVRGEVVSLSAAWREVVERHVLPAAVRDRLGELVAAALLLAATIKFDGTLILQIHGDGPVALYVVECPPDGSFRATVRMRDGVDPAIPIAPETPLSVLVNANGGGRFAVTLEPRERGQPVTQGIVPFEGETVAHVLENYMARSEQIPTRLWLAANATQAGGVLIQRLPTQGGLPIADTDGWPRMQHLGDTITATELCSVTPQEILHRLFWQESKEEGETRPLHFACRCSRERVGGMLKMLGEAEVESILTERETVEVRCDFCNQAYTFDAVDCAQLFLGPEALSSDVMTDPQVRH
jgi:molecular chaperone Hsp33